MNGTDFAKEKLGSRVIVRWDLGHDGRFFFVQALDPLITEPHNYRAFIDRPAYRAQRLLYPLLAGGFGLLSAEAVVWGMLVVNSLALAVGTLLTASIAERHGFSPWLGLTFLMNPGLLDELVIGGAGVVALALLVGGVYAIQASRVVLGTALLVGAVLSREVMLLGVLGLVAFDIFFHRKPDWRILFFPLVALTSWYLYVQARLEGSGTEVQEFSFIPFGDLLQSIEAWSVSSYSSLIGFALVVGAGYVIGRAARTEMRIVWATGLFSSLIPFLSVQVMGNHFNFARATAPVLIAVGFTAVHHLRTRQGSSASGVTR